MSFYKVPKIPDDSPWWLTDARTQALDLKGFIAVFGDETCVYCGRPAQEADHLVPMCISGKPRRRFVPTVPACQPCNTTLGHFPAPDVSSRAHYLAHRLLLLNGWLRRGEALTERSKRDHISRSDRTERLNRFEYLVAGGVVEAARRGLMPLPVEGLWEVAV